MNSWPLLCFALFTAACLAAPGPAPPASAKRALLIGINEYASEQVPDLRGAVNDVTLIARILETRFGFAPEHIRVLTDAEATREAVLAALDRLAAETGPMDTVYVHYSGHGSRRTDENGDEQDGFDETILPHDARTEDVPDILDDELDQRFARFRTGKALIVFDSCHSGTITRGALAQQLASTHRTGAGMLSPVQVRAVPPDPRSKPYQRIRTRDVVPVGTLNHVLMTGAPAEQEALDGPVGDAWYGLFSYSLATALNAEGPDASAITLHDRVREELRAVQASLNVVTPEPQLEAPAEALQAPPLAPAGGPEALPGGGSPEGRAWLQAARIGPDRVRLVDGSRLGAVPGSQWAIFGSDQSSFELGHARAAGTVQEQIGEDSILLVQHRAGTLPEAGKAIQLMPSDAWDSIPVMLLGVPPDRAKRLIDRIGDPAIRAATESEYPRFIIELAHESWRVRDSGGLSQLIEFADANDESVARTLADTILNASSGFALLTLSNPGSAIDLRVAVIDAALAESADVPVRGVSIRQTATPPAYVFRQTGEPRSSRNSLMLEIYSDRPGYISIVHIDTHGRAGLLFPNPHQRPDYYPQGSIPAGTPIRIPDSHEAANRAGFHWDYGPPAGRDTIRVFLSEDLDAAGSIRRSVGHEGSSALRSARTLRSDLTRSLVRGIVTAPAETAPAAFDWTVRTVVIDVSATSSAAEID